MANAVSGWSGKRISRTLETIVFWHLIREGFKVAYDIVGQEKCEVDFVVYRPGEKTSLAIQVCSDIGDETTMSRETKSLRLICKHNPAVKPIILTQFEPSRKSDIPVFTVLDLLGEGLVNKCFC
jgi:predicted AAA+ superfamily ATPase